MPASRVWACTQPAFGNSPHQRGCGSSGLVRPPRRGHPPRRRVTHAYTSVRQACTLGGSSLPRAAREGKCLLGVLYPAEKALSVLLWDTVAPSAGGCPRGDHRAPSTLSRSRIAAPRSVLLSLTVYALYCQSDAHFRLRPALGCRP